MKKVLTRSPASLFRRNPVSRLVARSVMASAIVIAGTPLAQAMNFELENGVTIDLDTTVGYNVQVRQESQDPNILSFGGLGFLTDDGNRNFDKGDLTQNQLNVSADLDVNYGDGGVFARARGWYDKAYDFKTAKPFQQDGIDDRKSTAELLDLFWYQGFDLGDQFLSLRVGKQVVNWGESLFIPGGISSAMGPVDATKASSPGVALKDIFMPLGQVYGELALSDTLSVGAYYQYDWEKTRIDAPGTYLNVLDGLGQQSVGDTDDTMQVVTEEKADKGQYGIALRYLAENLNNTEFGLYYLNYTDFTPALEFLSVDSSNLNQHYYDNIDLYGLSFGTVFGDMNVSGEVSYRDGVPVRYGVNNGFAYAPAKAVQAQVSGIYIFPQNPLADTLTFIGEIGYNRIIDIDSPLGGGIDDLTKNRNAASTVVGLNADYLNIAPGLDLKVSGTYRNDFQGYSSMEFSFAEGTEQFALKTDFSYLGNHKFGASYIWYLTDTDEILAHDGSLAFGHLNADRDYLAAYYKYTF